MRMDDYDGVGQAAATVTAAEEEGRAAEVLNKSFSRVNMRISIIAMYPMYCLTIHTV
jgi:hypothetical protein